MTHCPDTSDEDELFLEAVDHVVLWALAAMGDNPQTLASSSALPSSPCSRGGTVCSVNSFCPPLGSVAIRSHEFEAYPQCGRLDRN